MSEEPRPTVMLATMIGALLAKHRVIDLAALEDPEGYDKGHTAKGILLTVHDLLDFLEDRIGFGTNEDKREETMSELKGKVIHTGYIVEVVENEAWLTQDGKVTTVYDERGVWHEVDDARLALAYSMNPNPTSDATQEGGQR